MQKLNYSKKKQNYAVSSCKSDFLAFEQYSCYKPPVFNLISLFDMSAFGRLTGTFSSLAAATMLFATPACAQEDQSAHVTPVTMTTVEAANTNIEILPDADRTAGQWVYGHPNRLAVAVRVGPETQVPADRIAEVLSGDFESQGISNVPVFFEQGTAGGTTVTFVTDDYVYGPYLLQEVRDHVAEAVSQMRFNGRMTAALN